MSISRLISKQAEEKRNRLRESMWPDSQGEIWNGSNEKGYFCGPRSLPLLLRLLSDKRIVSRTSCSKVYLELLARHRGQGIVEIASEGDHAYFANYDLPRGIRSWRERIEALQKAGFIRIKPRPNQKIGYVLIVHPHLVATRLRAEGFVDDQWWTTYVRLIADTGASKPVAKPAQPALRVIKGGHRTKGKMKTSAKAKTASARKTRA